MKNRSVLTLAGRIFLLLLCVSLALPFPALAEKKEQKTVRVGWFDSSFCYWDQFGRRRGIDYEYQQKISAYTGWNYEYVEDSWSNLLRMLINGEIDLLSDVSYKPERAESMLFPDLAMGAESYYIYIDAKNREITADRLASFNGKRIGVNQGSIQEGFLQDWKARNGLDFDIVPLDGEEDESMAMLERGEIDGFTTIYTYDSEWKIVPVCRVGSSEYYYAVSKSRPDLLAELNMALSGIQDDDPYFKQSLSEKRLYASNTNVFLTPSQEDWLQKHGPIRIGYRDHFLPFCQADQETGKLTGALKDYLAHAENKLRSADIRFEPVPFPSTEAALDALKAGTIDCVFPLYLSSYDASEMGIRLTSPAMKTGINAVMRGSDHRGISGDSVIAFAVLAGDPNAGAFIMEQYPAGSTKAYPEKDGLFEAVAAGKADCVLISNYRLTAAEDLIKRYKLFSVPTGESLPLSFAVSKDDRDLYFILNKTAVMTNGSDMDSALASYIQSTQKMSFTQFLMENWIDVLLAMSAVFIIIVTLLLQKLKAERKVNEQQRMMEEGLRRELLQTEQLQTAMKMAFTDRLTGVKSKHAYAEAEELMDHRIAEGEAYGFSVVVFDLNDLKKVNDSKGHDTGDTYLKNACRSICTFFKHSPVYRIGGDEFVAILEGEDYENREELLRAFGEQMKANQEQGQAVLAFGCATFQPQEDASLRNVFERADGAMYKRKKEQKQ